MPKSLVSLALALGIVALLVVVGTWHLRIRDRRIARTRAGHTAEDFLGPFLGSADSRAVALSVYQYLQTWQRGSVEAFPVRAGDSIADLYGIVDEDLDEMVDGLLQQHGRAWPGQPELAAAEPVVTVRDLVYFIVAAPRARAKAAQSD